MAATTTGKNKQEDNSWQWTHRIGHAFFKKLGAAGLLPWSASRKGGGGIASARNCVRKSLWISRRGRTSFSKTGRTSRRIQGRLRQRIVDRPGSVIVIPLVEPQVLAGFCVELVKVFRNPGSALFDPLRARLRSGPAKTLNPSATRCNSALAWPGKSGRPSWKASALALPGPQRDRLRRGLVQSAGRWRASDQSA